MMRARAAVTRQLGTVRRLAATRARGLRPLHEALAASQTHRANLAAAGCAFFATLSLFPAVTVLLSLYGLVFSMRGVVPQLQALRGVLPDETHAVILRYVQQLVTHPHGTLGLGAALGGFITLWSAANGTASMLAALTLAYQGAEPGRLRLQLTSLAMTLAALVVATLALALLVALPAWLAHVGLTDPHVRPPRHAVLVHGGPLHALSLAVLTAFVAFCFAILYRFGATFRPREERMIWPGAAVATVLWLAASSLFSLYVVHLSGLDAMYGPIGATAGLMLWFYVGAWVTLFGAELNAALERRPRGPAAA